MANGSLQSVWDFPTIAFPSALDEMEEMLPTTIWPSTNLLQGLSVSEDDKNVYVEASVPGVDAKDVDVTYERGILTIKAETKEEKKEKTYYKKATQSFLYRITPGDVDPKAEPKAVCKNGIMTVTFTKMPEVKPRKIAVKAE